MQVAERKFFVGQVVLAKIKGYPPWPGTIVRIVENRLAEVVYFGWYEQKYVFLYYSLSFYQLSFSINHQKDKSLV